MSSVYFSGIGGVGLGPLAEIARASGYEVYGSDSNVSPTFKKLEKEGFRVSLDQSGTFMAHIDAEQPLDWFVHTAALPPNHPEILFAKSRGMRVTKRDELLKKIITDSNQELIAVAGTHGKTTTTAMVVWLFKQLGIPVSYLVGAPMSWAPSGAFERTSKYFVYECDEFDRNFLQFHPYLSLITSIGYDHPDTYPDQKSYGEAFDKFKVQSRRVISWDEVKSASISLPGEHNRRNGALAAKGVSQLTGQPVEKMEAMLHNFPGTSRRFEKLATNLYSDYAHHPEEIAATLELAGELSKQVVAVYQPHQNIRQHSMNYSGCFMNAEKIYWLPTYLSREDPNLEILTPQQLAPRLDSEKIIFAELDGGLAAHIAQDRAAGKLVVMMGAGSIDAWARQNLLDHSTL